MSRQGAGPRRGMFAANRALAGLVITVLLLAVSPVHAWATARQQETLQSPSAAQTDPAEGAQLSWPPREIKVTFPTDTVLSEVTFDLTDSKGVTFPQAAESLIEGDTILFQPPTLSAGRYTLRWSGAAAGQLVFAVASFENRGLSPLELRDENAGPGLESQTASQWFRYAPLVLVMLLTGLLLRRRQIKTALLVVTTVVVVTIVMQATDPIERTTETATLSCLTHTGESRIECLADAVVLRYEDGGAASARTSLLEIEQDPRFRSEYGENVCHSVAHTAAREIVLLSGSLRATLAGGGTVCASGFLHGALEGGAPVLTNEVFSKEASTVCTVGTSAAELECAHGIGHAAALRLNTRLRDSVNICRSLANSEQVTQCVLGAAMLYGSWLGNTSARGAVVAPAGATPGEVGEVCASDLFVETPALYRACLEGVFQYIKSGPEAVARLPLRWRDLNETASWCEDVASSRPELRVLCFASLGTASALRIWQKPETLSAVCARASTLDSRRECVRALITQVRNNSEVSPDLEIYESICRTIAVDLRAGCLRTAKRVHGR